MSDREALIDALVMSPMSDTVGTDISRISRTADEILASDWLRQHDAEVWAEGREHGASMPGVDPDVHNPYLREVSGDE